MSYPLRLATQLHRHADELAANSADWMPWKYRTTLEKSPPTRISSALCSLTESSPSSGVTLYTCTFWFARCRLFLTSWFHSALASSAVDDQRCLEEEGSCG